jgi:hypothetical protein
MGAILLLSGFFFFGEKILKILSMHWHNPVFPCRTPNELHKWIKMLLDSYHLNKEETDFMDARKMSDPVIIQRLTLLKETIAEEYMKQYIHPEEEESMDDN